MANKKISELPAAGALTGAELVESVQGGVNVKTTTQDIADLAGAAGTQADVTLANGVVAIDMEAGDVQFLTITETKVITSITNSFIGTIALVIPGTFSVTFTTINATISGAYNAGEQNIIWITCIDATGTPEYTIAYENSLSAVVGVQDLYIPATAMWPRATNPCADVAKSELATSLLNIQSLDFDQTTQEFAQFTIVLPRKYNNGTITAVFYWTASAGAGDVQWGISAGAYSNDDALTVALGTAVTVDDTLIATNDLHVTAATGAMTVAGTPADADFLGFQISRNPGSDTLTGDAKLLGVSLRITTDAAKDA